MAEVEKETIPHGHDHKKNSADKAGNDDKHHEIISSSTEAAHCRTEAEPAPENKKEHDHEHHAHAGHHHDEHHEHTHDHCSDDHYHDHSHDHHNHSHEHDDEDEEIIDDDPRLEAGNDSLWRVEGMDCAACARTITTALERMSGVENVHVSLTRERLSLKADKSRVSPEEIEKTVASLGYHLLKIDNNQPREQQEEKYWYQTQKGQAAILSGVLLALAYIASTFLPHLSFWFFTIAALAALLPVAKRAFAALKNGSPFTIEMLMTIAAIGAIFINATQEAAVVVFLFCVGEVLEGVATGHARAGIKSLSKLAPKTAWKEVNGKLEEVPAESLQIDDIVLARPGDRLPADGVVIEGTSGVDESPITGESIPVTKTINSKVFAGSINNESTLRIRVETKPSDNTIARIISLVEEAQDAKAPTERFIDAFSKVYMPIIVGIAILVAIIPPLFDGQWREWTYRGLALLLIGCPCALVISVPAAIASGLSTGTRHGLLVKGGNVVETLSKVDCITFDKTGTLTKGTPVVTDVVATEYSENEVLQLAVALERESSHPLAVAIITESGKRKIEAVSVKDVKAVAGKGIIAEWKGKPVFIGAPRFSHDYGVIGQTLQKSADKFESEGKTVVVVHHDGKAIGVIAMRDEPRDDALAALEELRRLNIEAVMLTGDNKQTGEAIARKLGLAVKAELMPGMKVEAIKELGKNHIVAMVGDGINDAPALAAANVGIAMGSGTDVALETADAAILRNRVSDIPTLISLARATMLNIKENVAIALGLKLIFLLTTIFGITGLWLAVMADTGATVLVTLNALRLLLFKK
ncbi:MULTISPECIES: heavy metal translocating P-type ATPase [Bartonella]|uniref:heavy metal translocating P-type ATPase n=1 Tax=Bartonella TaxID=773 RepID=UPI0018DE8C6E|nr:MULTISPECIES: heavy metal translocating P-type ATPase [Bartonella]MBH9994969.1 cadmium-translocating P-type ATPase [Bartonella sp. P0291]MBH9996686.1 cadmium-translocating P-type ATPase [Bartonella sp. M0192]MBH9998846.1 cadmium-translocating P-type ATPase [Bartonella sp. M0191]MBI0007770.1 cadmium-translocating P-type ATPase [Bartonella sp. M0193]MBI0010137.1 cadmium-translocating P-type ATPase [Bartonella sp. M0176]